MFVLDFDVLIDVQSLGVHFNILSCLLLLFARAHPHIANSLLPRKVIVNQLILLLHHPLDVILVYLGYTARL